MGSLSVAEVKITGMTCGACTSAVTSALTNTPGVQEAVVALITERARVVFEGKDTSSILGAVEDAGFEAELISLKAVPSAVGIPPTDSIAESRSSVYAPETEAIRTEVSIDGMTCTNCSTSVTKILEKIDGVGSVNVSLELGRAVIIHSFKVTPENLAEVVNSAGFDAAVIQSKKSSPGYRGLSPMNSPPHNMANSNDMESTLGLKIFGMRRKDDEVRLQTLLREIPGVLDADVIGHTAQIRFRNQSVGIRGIMRVLESAGFSALVAMTADNSEQVKALNRVKELQAYYRDAQLTFILGVPVILADKLRVYLPDFMKVKVVRGIWLDDLLSIALVIPIVIGPAHRFYTKAIKALRAGSPTMDVLVTTSVLCAFLYSIVALAHSIIANLPEHQMYLWDACAMIIMFVLIGKYLENLARGQTSQALSELISLVPEESLVIASDTSEQGELIATDMLQVGDIVVLRPGERISADGIVVSGESFVSESLLTGEASPVYKGQGASLVGGTINGLGTLQFRVTSCGADTKLSQIVAFIKEAQNSQTPIQRYVDLAASRFVPTVMGLALLTFTVWMILGFALGKDRLPPMFKGDQSLFFSSLRLGIAVIVVACPCALGLATPTAVMVATSVGAKHGILVKGGGIFELGSQVSIVLFDKTGTLTTGRMSVTAQDVPAKYWPMIRALESVSEHPAGKALGQFMHPDESEFLRPQWSDKPPFEAVDVRVQVGEGISGLVNGVQLFVGRRRAKKDRHITVIADNEIVGHVELYDSLRAEAHEVVEVLQARGYQVGILSGDSAEAVNLIAEELSISPELTWNSLKPDDKVDIVESFKADGHKVAFVGDGINDSAALIAASVGLSLEGATHVAVESADIVLTQLSPISAVPSALDLCKTAMRRIKLNLLSSVVYNVIMIPFAMGLLLPCNLMLTPIMASAAMAMSSVSVVVSSLMLKLWNPDPSTTPHTWWSRIIPERFWRSRKATYMPV